MGLDLTSSFPYIKAKGRQHMQSKIACYFPGMSSPYANSVHTFPGTGQYIRKTDMQGKANVHNDGVGQ
jgi:hypothetical protein